VLSKSWITDSQGLIIYTLGLLAYLSIECINLRLTQPKLFWINPAVLASIFTFILAFGFSNMLFFMPNELIEMVGLEPIATPWMNLLMRLVVLGALAMWLGYASPIGEALGRSLQGSKFLNRVIRSSNYVNYLVICLCVLISLVTRILMIRLGVYGFSADYEQVIAAAAYTQYLSMGESLGQLALVGMGLSYFASPRPKLTDTILFLLILTFEVLFGFLSGYKSQVFMPFIIVGLVFYTQRGRFPKWFLPLVLVGIVLAYAVIEPFRDARHQDLSFEGTSIGSIATTMVAAGSDGSETEDRPSTALSVLARINMTHAASKGIEYAAMSPVNESGPNFLSDLLLSPAHAVIPRMFWDSKPYQNIGLWYTFEVMGLADPTLSSTAMGPFTYLNFAGGPVAVVIGFFIVGLLQRALFDGMRQFGGGGLIVFLGLLRNLVLIDSAFNSFLTSIIRLPALLVPAQYFLLCRSKDNSASRG